ncbi:PCRF domain-containing protein, partial [Candidatus Saccharibacteria bacterium]|nr:PCRF domain-containing protein [Candidatus Saccharibacteria bacterium]
MQPLKKRLDTLKTNFAKAYTGLDIEAKLTMLAELETEVAQPEIWNNPEFAKQKTEELNKLNNLVQPWQTIKVQLGDIDELLAIGDESLLSELTTQVEVMETDFNQLKKQLLFNGQFDNDNVILRLTSGVGGLDAQD